MQKERERPSYGNVNHYSYELMEAWLKKGKEKKCQGINATSRIRMRDNVSSAMSSILSLYSHVEN